MVAGQKVVCINDEAPAILRSYYTAWVKKGTVYVIRDVFLGVDIKAGPGEVGVYLLGLHNPKSDQAPFPERGFNSNRFRPIEDHTITLKKVEEVEAEISARSAILSLTHSAIWPHLVIW